MDLASFEQLPLWATLVAFAIAAGAVWLAGTRLSHYAEPVAARSGFGHAFIGVVMLGGITSLPELATTVTAAAAGNASLAVNNVFGGVAMQVAILAVADAIHGARTGLSGIVDASTVMLEASGGMLVLSIAAVGITVGSTMVLGVDLWTVALLVGALVCLFLVQRSEARPQWQPRVIVDEPDTGEEQAALSNVRLALGVGVAGIVVLGAGYVVARTGEVIADRSGLGASFVGATLVAVTTSLPELSTTLASVRRGRYRLAFSNVFGTNLIDVALLFVADLAFRGGGVLDEAGAFAQVAALLGVVVTGVYLVGLLVRSQRTVLRMGFDSAMVLAVYLGGMGLLYTMR